MKGKSIIGIYLAVMGGMNWDFVFFLTMMVSHKAAFGCATTKLTGLMNSNKVRACELESKYFNQSFTASR